MKESHVWLCIVGVFVFLAVTDLGAQIAHAVMSMIEPIVMLAYNVGTLIGIGVVVFGFYLWIKSASSKKD
jgi:hypothetical protein